MDIYDQLWGINFGQSIAENWFQVQRIAFQFRGTKFQTFCHVMRFSNFGPLTPFRQILEKQDISFAMKTNHLKYVKTQKI